jgi:glyoxylase-like metal-dependent hydrolase (beta-lactamase superfamily II)
MSTDLRVLSIGTLAAHPLWNESGSVRTGHATTTLVRAGKRVILVDPGLPEQAVVARLYERAGLRPKDITHVFLTSFKPEVCRGIMGFPSATWWISLPEREGVGVPLVGQLQRAAAEDDEQLRAGLELDVAVLRRCEPAPDRVAPGVDLFPLPGVTPGLTGLLLSGAKTTTLIVGDAIATTEHLERGMVLDSAANVTQARESFAEAVEIADDLVLGRDNLVRNPVKRPF